MGKYFINGGKKITGSLKSDGSKNSVLPILAASILNSGESVIHNCPNISDLNLTLEILKNIGCKIKFNNNTVIINAKNINSCYVPEKLVSEMRSSIIFLGSILSRMKQVSINYPGGCKLGKRPIDFHIKSLKKLGAQISEQDKLITCNGENLKSNNIRLRFPSVGATQNIMLAAVLTPGTTQIINAAREPEIIDLNNFLIKMGANIKGAGTEKIIINGVKKLNSNIEHSIIPDRIVAGTYLLAAAITNGNIILENIIPEHLPLEYFKQTGCIIKTYKDKIYLRGPDNIKPIKFKTKPYPGFPTDLQAPFLSLLTLAKGKSIIYEKIFESRSKHIPELIKMGADIKIIQDKIFIINGVNKLNSNQVISKDLRGGAALILAGLAAEGQTVIQDKNYISRGYDNIAVKLKSLGADIKYKKTTEQD